jgi:hypothetical protein
LDGVKANARIRLFLELVVALVIGRTIFRAIFRKHRNTETGSLMNVVSRVGTTFLAIHRFRNRGKRALQRSSSISLDSGLGVGGD